MGDAGQAKPGAPGQVTSAAKAATGIIRGRVVSAETGAPLRRARVVLNDGQRDARATSSDADGRYEFRELPALRYSVTASKPMYVPLQYGQRSTRDAGRPVDLTIDAAVEKIDIALPRGGVIAGRVFDDLGEPVEYVRVAAMRLQYFDGRRQLVPLPASYVRTNDLGEYRIYGLAPGRYYVGTAPPVAGSVPRPRAGRAFAPSYFPGTSTLADARPFDVDAGQERADADFALVVSRPLKVSGIVMDRQGRAVSGVSVVAMQPMGVGGFLFAARATLQPNGAFTIEDLAPGDYTLFVERTNQATEAEEAAAERITVGGADIDGIVMTMVPMVTMTGRIRADSRADQMPALKDVLIQREVGSPLSLNVRSSVAGDGTFEVRNLALGPTRLALSRLPAGWSLKAVVHAGRDVTDTLNLREDLSGVEIIVTNRVSEVSGVVTDAANRALDDYTVVVYADDASRWNNPRFVATARPDQNGRFSVKGLAAGDYLAVAVHLAETGDAADPEFLERMRSHATKTRLGDGETKSLDLKVVTP